MNQQKTTELVERFWRAFLDTGPAGAAAIADLVTPDVQFRGSLGIAVRGAEGIADYCLQIRKVFQGFTVELREVISSGNRVAARLAFSGTHREELFGIAPTGKHLRFSGTAWMTLEGDRFSEIRVTGDAAQWLIFFHGLER
jgi:predicted ester cyclase